MKRHHLLFVILAWVFAGCGDLILKPQLLIERTLERKNGEWVETRLQSSGELPFIPMPPVVKGLTQEGVFSIGDAYSSSSTGRHHTFNRNSLLITVAGKQQELVLAANEIPEQLKDIPHLNQITIVHTLDGIEQLPIHDVWVHLEPLVWEPAMPENGNELFGKIGILSTNSHAVSFYPHKANLPRYTFGNRSACTMYATPTFEGNIIGDLADYLISQCRDLMTSQFKEKPMSTPHHVYLNQVDSPTTVPLDWLKEIEPIMEGNAPLSASVRIWNITGFATSKEAQDQIRDELR